MHVRVSMLMCLRVCVSSVCICMCICLVCAHVRVHEYIRRRLRLLINHEVRRHETRTCLCVRWPACVHAHVCLVHEYVRTCLCARSCACMYNALLIEGVCITPFSFGIYVKRHNAPYRKKWCIINYLLFIYIFWSAPPRCTAYYAYSMHVHSVHAQH